MPVTMPKFIAGPNFSMAFIGITSFRYSEFAFTWTEAAKPKMSLETEITHKFGTNEARVLAKITTFMI